MHHHDSTSHTKCLVKESKYESTNNDRISTKLKKTDTTHQTKVNKESGMVTHVPPLNPTIGEAVAGNTKFKANLGFMVRLCLKIKK